MTKVALTGPKASFYVQLDADDVTEELINAWVLDPGYSRPDSIAARTMGKSKVYLHRLIGRRVTEKEAHGAYALIIPRNGDHLDCRRENLRWLIPQKYYGA